MEYKQPDISQWRRFLGFRVRIKFNCFIFIRVASYQHIQTSINSKTTKLLGTWTADQPGELVAGYQSLLISSLKFPVLRVRMFGSRRSKPVQLRWLCRRASLLSGRTYHCYSARPLIESHESFSQWGFAWFSSVSPMHSLVC